MNSPTNKDPIANPYASPNDSASGTEDALRDIPFPLFEEVDVTLDILTDAHLAEHGTGSRIIRIAAATVGTLSTFAGIVVLIGNIPSLLNGRLPWVPFAAVLSLLIGMGLFLLCWGLMGASLSRSMLRRTLARRKASLGPVLYEFTPDEIIVHNAGPGYRATWNQLTRWKMHKQVCIAFYATNAYLILPLQVMSAEANDVIQCKLGIARV